MIRTKLILKIAFLLTCLDAADASTVSHAVECSFKGGLPGGVKLNQKGPDLVDLGIQEFISDGENPQELQIDLSKQKSWKWGPGRVRLYIEAPTAAKGDVTFDLEADLPSRLLNVGESSIPLAAGAKIKISRFFKLSDDDHRMFTAECKILR